MSVIGNRPTGLLLPQSGFFRGMVPGGWLFSGCRSVCQGGVTASGREEIHQEDGDDRADRDDTDQPEAFGVGGEIVLAQQRDSEMQST
jgi:hypothetical protein